MKRIKIQQGYLAKRQPKRVKYYDQGLPANSVLPPRELLMQKSKEEQDMGRLMSYVSALQSLDKNKDKKWYEGLFEREYKGKPKSFWQQVDDYFHRGFYGPGYEDDEEFDRFWGIQKDKKDDDSDKDDDEEDEMMKQERERRFKKALEDLEKSKVKKDIDEILLNRRNSELQNRRDREKLDLMEELERVRRRSGQMKRLEYLPRRDYIDDFSHRYNPDDESVDEDDHPDIPADFFAPEISRNIPPSTHPSHTPPSYPPPARPQVKKVVDAVPVGIANRPTPLLPERISDVSKDSVSNGSVSNGSVSNIMVAPVGSNGDAVISIPTPQSKPAMPQLNGRPGTEPVRKPENKFTNVIGSYLSNGDRKAVEQKVSLGKIFSEHEKWTEQDRRQKSLHDSLVGVVQEKIRYEVGEIPIPFELSKRETEVKNNLNNDDVIEYLRNTLPNNIGLIIDEMKDRKKLSLNLDTAIYHLFKNYQYILHNVLPGIVDEEEEITSDELSEIAEKGDYMFEKFLEALDEDNPRVSKKSGTLETLKRFYTKRLDDNMKILKEDVKPLYEKLDRRWKNPAKNGKTSLLIPASSSVSSYVPPNMGE